MAWTAKFALSSNYAYKIPKAALNMLDQQYAFNHAEAGFTFLCVSLGVKSNTYRHNELNTNGAIGLDKRISAAVVATSGLRS